VTTEALRAGRRKPRLLDLFCGAGGAGMGYHRAGFDVVGVDIEPQPRYPFEFHQADALTFPLDGFDVVHASPPCQAWSPLAALPNAGKRRPPVELIEPTRTRLETSGLPYIIENVSAAPLASAADLFGANGVMLCGTMFGLRVYRHRKFETRFAVVQPAHRRHVELCMRAGYLPTAERPFMSIHGRGGHNSKAWVQAAAEHLGAPWMGGDLDATCEAIPPAYTQFIGEQLAAHLAQSDLVGEAS
jgi:DNA (cytosine-5)-methyltransferase 1